LDPRRDRPTRYSGPAGRPSCLTHDHPEAPIDSPASAAVHTRPTALALLVLLSIVWGVHWAVVKIGLEFMPPFSYAALRVAVALVTLILLLATQRRLRSPARSDLPIVFSVGLGQIAAGALIMNLALQVVPAGRSSVLLYTMPLCVAVLLALAFGIRPRRHEVVGLVLGLAGLAALLNPTVIDWGASGELAGTLALLLNSVIWGAVTIHVRRHHWTRTPLELQPWQLLVALVPLALLALVTEAGRSIRWEPATVLVLLYSGALATAFTTWAYQSITRSLGPQAAATGFLAVPVVGLASGALILGESLGLADLIGFGLVLAGIAATSLISRDGPTPAEVARA
jgi:drug/metabolite transporter (DMT)-like permease